MTVAEIVVQFWNELMSRPGGPLAFRFVLQPIMAIAFAIRDGMHDAKGTRSPYFWTILFHPVERKDRLREGWQSVGRVFVLAAAMDITYQLIQLKAFRPVETLVVAFVLAFVPYLLARGPVTRIARRFWHRKYT